MDNLKALLQSRGNQVPPEIQLIQDYVKDRFNASVSVVVQEKQILINASSAALAGTLRLHSYELSKVCQTDKKLVFKIGS